MVNDLKKALAVCCVVPLYMLLIDTEENHETSQSRYSNRVLPHLQGYY
jgi:hypothetical protein